MASHGDRLSIDHLHRLPNNLRDASGNSKNDPWKGQEPVVIPTPSNSTRYLEDMAKTPAKNTEKRTLRKAVNPRAVFDSRIASQVGNRTAAATFVQNTSSVSGYKVVEDPRRPSKRQKTNNHASAPAVFSNSGGTVVEKPKTKRQPNTVPIVVDDDDDEVTVLSHNPDPDNSGFKVPKHNFDQDDALSDDLNIHSGEPGSAQRASKFSFDKSRQRTTPDGPNTTELMKGKVFDIESDPIEDFTDRVSPPPSTKGYVKEQALKIDLRNVQTLNQPVKVQSLRMKMKLKDRQFDVDDFTEPAPAYSTETKSSHITKEGFIVEEGYIDADHIKSAPQQVIRMRLDRDGYFYVEDDREVYAKEPVKHLSVEHPHPPQNGQDVIQFKNLLDRKPRLITLRLDLASLIVNPFVEMMSKMRKHGTKVATHSASQQLWQIAEQNAGVLMQETNPKMSKDRGDILDGSSRMAELESIQKRKKHDLGPAPTSSRTTATQKNLGKRKADESPLKYTPPTDDEIDPPRLKTIKKPNAPSLINRPQKPTRRSSRQQEAKEPKKVKDLKNDELILSYPQGQPGAVNVTAGDLNRLEPGEFLNDTLIEFGLKYWLHQLEIMNPALASQVHVFNSFFYKKFNQKDLQVGYQSVRKWTSKIDIFQKKYIIVPINEHLHWYLIVIHEPEHVLTSHGPPPTPSARPQTRSVAAEVEQAVQISTEETSATSANTPVTSEDIDRTSEAEVERDLHDFQNSCNIAEPDSRMASPPAPKEDNLSDIYADPVPPIDADGAPDSEDSFGDRYADPVLPLNADTEAAKGDEFIELVATTFTSDEEVQQPKSPSASEVMCIDVDKDDSPSSTGAVVAQAGLSKDNRNNDSASTAKLRTVEPASFYKPAERTHVRKGKEKAQDLSTAPAPMDVDSKEDDDEVMVVSDTPQTRIFTFDSLGSKHPAAIKKLATYLQMEAKDKKGIENAGMATGWHAPVPCQQNFCDCGVFLLHFAETFFSDAKKYTNVILSKGKSPTGAERSELWRQAELHNDQGRAKLKEAITDLSKEWKLQRATTSEQMSSELDSKEQVKVEESDDDIEVIDVQGVKKGKPKAAVGNTAKRKMGVAARVRG